MNKIEDYGISHMKSQLNQSMRAKNEKLPVKEYKILNIFKKKKNRYTLVHQFQKRKRSVSKIIVLIIHLVSLVKKKKAKKKHTKNSLTI